MVTQILHLRQQPRRPHSPRIISQPAEVVVRSPTPHQPMPQPVASANPIHTLPSTFPVFSDDGDIGIVISSANSLRHRRYLLHGHVLSQCSAFFRTDSPRSRSGYYRLDRDMRTSSCAPRLAWVEHALTTSASSPALSSSAQSVRPHMGGSVPARCTMASRPTPVPSSRPFVHSVDFDDDIFRDYDNLFRVFYNLVPALDTGNVASAYTECKALLHLAQVYDALDVVGPRVDHHLLCFGNRLFRQIAKYPPSYLKLGLLAKSKVIFSEALTHVVGQWPRASSQLNEQISPATLDLIEDKVEQLGQVKQRVEHKLHSLTVKTSDGDRCTPSNDLIAWLATSLFRQWLVESTATSGSAESSLSRLGHGSPGRDVSPEQALCSRSIFLTLGSSDPDSYLSRDECCRFFKTSALQNLYTKETFRHFVHVLDQLKDKARETVRPLTRVNLQLIPTQNGTGGHRRRETQSSSDKYAPCPFAYLTCTRVHDGELPWVM